VLASSKSYFEKKQGEERVRVGDALKKLGIDWTTGNGGAALSSLAATLTSDKPDNKVTAGESLTLTATVANNGSQAATQVRGVIKSDDYFFDSREFVFGRIKPGETRTFAVPIKVPKDALTRMSPLKLEIGDEKNKPQKTQTQMTLAIAGMARPTFAYSYQLIDDIAGNGDGQVQRGESVRMRVTVKNIGAGKSHETLAQLRNLSDEGLDIVKGRFNVDNLAPGETKSVDFTFDVSKDYRPDTFKVELTVYDSILHEYVTDKLTFPIAQPGANVATSTGSVMVVADNTAARSAPNASASAVATLARGQVLKRTGIIGGWVRAELDAGRPVFLPQEAVSNSSTTPTAAPQFAQAWQVSPPRLTVTAGERLVDGGQFKLHGEARDDKRVADVYVFVSNRGAKIDRKKVFYRSNRNGAVAGKLAFDADIPLWPGANIVTVVARESTQVTSQETLVIERVGSRMAGAVADQPAKK
jgi:carboxyl-terminal processing protease